MRCAMRRVGFPDFVWPGWIDGDDMVSPIARKWGRKGVEGVRPPAHGASSTFGFTA